MAPLPPGLSHQQPAGGRPAPRRIPTNHRTNHERPPPADLNRPLPPPPPSAAADVDGYEIPTLHRKPVPDTPDHTPSRGNHNRSFSHPFPSIFGSKRSEKRTNPRGDAQGPGGRDEGGTKNPPTEGAAQRADRQPVTGKCMTCDSTVRWPQGLKVFRCTTCLTINDLEINPDKIPDPSVPHMALSAPRKMVPLSLERTRALIDSCVRQHLEAQVVQHDLADRAPGTLGQSPTNESCLVEGVPLTVPFRGQPNDEQDSPPPSPSVAKARTLSNPTPIAVPPGRNGASFVQGSSTDPFMASSWQQHTRAQDVKARDAADAATTGPMGPRTDVFRAVENYIAGCFVGCATLNHSFLVPKSRTDSKPRSSSATQARRHLTEPTAAPLHDSDVVLSELDAKTLLLGDVAENGSWWLGGHGGRQAAPGKESHQRDRSPEKTRGGAMTSRSPRIHWPELAEWYRVVIYAGEKWEHTWHEIRANLGHAEAQRWGSIPLEQLQRDMTESRIHLHRTLLKITENLLKRPRQPLRQADDCRFLLILLSNPLLTPGRLDVAKAMATNPTPSAPPGEPKPAEDRFRGSPSKPVPTATRRPGSLGHHSGIIKRILGLLANMSNESHQSLVSWFARYPDGQFQRTVEMIGSFVTYRLSRQQKRPTQEPINPTEGLVPSFSESGTRHASQVHAALEGRPSSTSAGTDAKPRVSAYGEDWQVRAAARVMALLFQANMGHLARKRDVMAAHEQRVQSSGLNAKYQAHSYGQIIPISYFYNTMLDYSDLVADFELWETTKTRFTFCQYPFFLSIYAKIHILEHDARRQMEVKAREAFFDSILSRKAVSQYLVLRVRRDCLVEDSLRGVSEVVGSGGSDIKKGLRIDFQGEEGIDAGGLRKEWFLLLVREIFDPDHGLFVYDDDSQYCYFNPFCFESSEQFFLVGVLLGLAIYNSTILDVAFPPFVFKKMLASAPSAGEKLTSTPKVGHGLALDDLAEYRPALARGLRQLLEFDGDVEATFCRDFVVDTERYGEIVRVPLCAGGDKRAVTNSNRKEFVDLYVHYLLDAAVARQYEPFKRGFFTVCGGNALSLFRPEEIELLVRGSDEPLDISSLRAVATYEGWPKSEGPPERQPQVVWFWDFFARASPMNQRKILSFITGSDRIPAMGATNLIIRVQLIRGKDDTEDGRRPLDKSTERFPIARTCFNTLSLYRYQSRQQLEHKLWTAVAESEGFGLK